MKKRIVPMIWAFVSLIVVGFASWFIIENINSFLPSEYFPFEVDRTQEKVFDGTNQDIDVNFDIDGTTLESSDLYVEYFVVHTRYNEDTHEEEYRLGEKLDKAPRNIGVYLAIVYRKLPVLDAEDNPVLDDNGVETIELQEVSSVKYIINKRKVNVIPVNYTSYFAQSLDYKVFVDEELPGYTAVYNGETIEYYFETFTTGNKEENKEPRGLVDSHNLVKTDKYGISFKNEDSSLYNIYSGIGDYYVSFASGSFDITSDEYIDEMSNYELIYQTATLTVNPLPVTFEWDQASLSVTYNGDYQKPKATFDTEIQGVDLTYALTNYQGLAVVLDTDDASGRSTLVNVADSTTVTYVGLNNKNYTYLGEAKSTYFEINPKVIDIAWEENEFVYNGSYQMAIANITTTLYFNKKANALDTASLTYANENGYINANGTINVVDGVANISYEDVNAYISSITGVTNENYTLDTTKDLTKKYFIQPKLVNVTWDSNNAFEYNKNTHNISATINQSDLCGTDTITLVYDHETNSKVKANYIDVNNKLTDDTYYSNIINDDINNYYFSSYRSEYKIYQKTITITWDADEVDTLGVPYTKLIYSGKYTDLSRQTLKHQYAQATIDEGMICADSDGNYDVVSLIFTGKNYEANYNSITGNKIDGKDDYVSNASLDGADSNNYKIVENLSCNYRIYTSNQEVELSNELPEGYEQSPSKNSSMSYVYNALDFTPIASFVNSLESQGFIEDENEVISIAVQMLASGSTEYMDSVRYVGTYQAETMSISNINYTIAEVQYVDIEITPRPIEIKWYVPLYNADGVVVGKSEELVFNYDTNTHIPFAEIEGLCAVDTGLDGENNPLVYITVNSANAQVNANKTYTTKTYIDSFAAYNVELLKDVNGSYYLSGSLKDNYMFKDETQCNAEFDILQAPLTISSKVNTITYGDVPTINTTDHFEVVGLVGTDKDDVFATLSNLNYEISYNQFDDVTDILNGVTYTSIWTGVTNTNYEITYNEADFIVDKKDVTIVWDSVLTHVYNGQSWAPEVSISGLVNNDEVLLERNDYQINSNQTAGNAAYTASVIKTYSTDGKEQEKNYNVTNIDSTAQFTITQRPVTINWIDTVNTYSSERWFPTYTFNNVIGNDVLNEVTSGEQTDANATVAGTLQTGKSAYVATITSLGNLNYKLAENSDLANPESGVDVVAVNSTEFYIKALGISVNWSVGEYTYSGLEQLPEVTSLSTVYAADSANVTTLISASSTSTVNGFIAGVWAGNHTALATLSGYRAFNYEIVENETQDYEIAKALLTITNNDHSIIYGAVPSNNGYVTSGLVNGETVENLNGEIQYTYSYEQYQNIGSYVIESTGFESNNYEITYVTSVLTVVARPVEIEWTVLPSYTYNGQGQAPTAAVTNLVNNDECIVTVEQFVYANVDSEYYTTTPTALSNSNYTLVGTTYSQDFTILPKPITLNWDNYADLTYNAQVQVITVSSNDIVEGDVVEITFEYIEGDGKLAGSHKALASITNTNYVINVNETLTYEIAKKEVIITWDEETELVYNAQNQILGAEHSGLISGDDCVVEFTGYGKNVNTYIAEAILVGTSASNYEIKVDATCEYKIIQKEVTVTWTEKDSFVYDKTEQQPTATVTGLIENDTVSVNHSTGNVVVGNYTATIELVGESASNYVLSDESKDSKDYTITPKLITIVWSEYEDLIYNGKVQTISLTSNDIIDGDTVNYSYSYKSEEFDGKSAGSHTVIAAIDNDNYKINENLELTYSIAKLEVEIKWGTLVHTYDGTLFTPTATVANLISGDECTLTVTGGQTDAGTYTATVSELDNDNYVLPENVTNAFEIKQKEVTLTWSTTSDLIYSGAKHTFTVEIEGVVTGDTVEYDVVYVTSGIDATNHTVKAVLKNANYTIKENKDTYDYEITAKEITISWSKLTGNIYNGQEYFASAEITNLIGEDTCTFDIIGSGINAGSYEVSIANLGNANYKLPENGIKETLVITPRTITVSWTNTTLLYTGSAIAPTATAGNLVDGESVILEVTGAAITVGKHTATVSRIFKTDGETVNTNYQLPENILEYSTEFIINKSAIVFTIYGVTITYGNTLPTLSTNIADKGSLFYYVIPEFEGDDTYENSISGTLTIDTTYEQYSSVGIYTFIATGLTSDKYEIQYEYIDEYITVNQYVINEITWNTTLIYNAENQLPTASFEALRDEDDNVVLVGIQEGTESYKDANTAYYAIATGTSNANYKLSTEVLSKEQEYVIAQKPITITWSNETTFVYNMAPQQPESTVTGLIEGDAVEVVLSDGGINVGNYTATVSLSGDSKDNYSYVLETASKAYSITPKTVTITWSEANTFVYNQKIQQPTATVSGIIEGDDVIVVPSEGQINAGNHTASVAFTGSSADNYAVAATSSTTKAYTITPKTITIVWDGYQNLTYNGQEQLLSLTSNDIISGDEVEYTYSFTIGDGKSAGSHTAKAKIDNNNYVITTNETLTYSIAKKELTITWATNTALEYNAQEQILEARVDGIVDEECLVKFNGKNKNVGNYTAEVYLEGTTASNYEIKANKTCGFSIYAKEITITWTEETTFVYNKTAQQPIATPSGLIEGDAVSYTHSEGNVSVGNYTASITFSGSSYSNYVIASTSLTTKAYTITPKEVTIIWSGYTGLIYNGTEQTISLTSNDIISGDVCNYTYEYTVGDGKSAISHTVKAFISNTNYEIVANKTLTYSIAKKEITVSWSGLTGNVYDGKSHTATATVTNLVIGDSCTLTVEGEGTNAGSYPVSITALSNPNYGLPEGGISETLVIDQREVTMTWSETSDLIYNGSEHKFNIALGNVVSGETLLFEIDYDDNINAGSHTAVASIKNPNYVIKTGDETHPYVIAAKEITVSWSGLTHVYDGTTYQPTATITNLVGDDECSFTIDGSGKNVNSYAVSIINLGNPNYKLPEAGIKETLVITPRTITVSWTNTTLIYTGQPLAPTASAGNVADGDTVVLSVSGAQTAVGTYTATVSAILNTENKVDANYQLPEKVEDYSTSFTIGKSVITVTVYGLTITYGDNKPLLTSDESLRDKYLYYTVAGFEGTDNVNNSIKGTLSLVTDYDRLSDVGSYGFTVTGFTSDNYAINYVYEGVITVNPYVITTITWNKELTYNAQNQLPTATFTLLTGDASENNVVTVGSANTGDIYKNANVTYKAIATGTNNDNYVLSDTVLEAIEEYVISAKEVTVTWTEKDSFVYDKTKQQPTATVTGLIENDTVSVNHSTGNVVVGKYTAIIELVGESAFNYVLSDESKDSKDYEITPKLITIVWSGYEDLIYNGKVQTISLTSNDIIDGDTVNYSYSYRSEEFDGKSAGSQTVIAAIDNDNYKINENLELTYSIAKLEVEIEWGTLVHTYDRTEFTPTATVVNLVSGDTCTLTVTGGNTDAGTYTATLTAVSNANYTLPTNVTKEFTITPREVTLTWTPNTNLTYNGATHKFTIAIDNDIEADDLGYAITYTTGSVNAGNHTATATLTNNDLGNYVISENATHTYEIEKLTIEIEWGTLVHTYDRTEFTPTATVANLVSGDECTLTVTGGQTNTGKDYEAKVTAVSNDNYALPTNVTEKFTIIPREVTMTWSETSDLIYNGSEHEFNITLGNVVSGETLSFEINYEDNINAGNHTAVASITNNNYVIKTGDETKKYVITAKEITVSWSGLTHVYDGTTYQPTATITNLVGDDECSFTIDGSGKNVNSYAVSITNLGNPNYKLPEAGIKETLVITPREVTMTWSKTSDLIYSGSEHVFNITLGNVVSGERLSFEIDYEDNINAGSHTAVASITNPNYVIKTGDETNKYVIAAKEIEVSWSGLTHVYDGTTYQPTATITNLVGKDECSFTIDGSGKNVNSYAVSIINLGNPNYKLPEAGIKETLVIDQREVTLTWTQKTDLIYNGAKHEFTIAINNDIKADNLGYAITYTTGSIIAGDHTAKATLINNDLGNYVISENATHTYSIAKLKVEIEWGKLEHTYDAALFTPTATVKNKVSSDTIKLTVTGGKTDAGTYTATVTEILNVDNTVNTNYVLPTSVTNEFTINPREIGISWSGLDTHTYNGVSYKPTATATGLIGEDACTITVSGEQTNAGTNYVATATAVSNTNYKLPQNVTAKFSITPRTITVSWTNTALTYTGLAIAPTATAGNVVDGETVVLSVSGAQTNVGTYTATVSAILNADNTVNTNYQLTEKVEDYSTSFKISESVITVTVYGLTITYGDAIPGFTTEENKKDKFLYYTISGLKGNDSTSVVTGTLELVTTYAKFSSVGEYTFTVKGLSSANYAIEYKYEGVIEVVPYVITSISSIVWSNATLTYNGKNQLPTATFTLLSGDTGNNTVNVGIADNLTVYKNANVDYYALATSTNNTNYVLAESVFSAKQLYRITPKTIEISWNTTERSFEYDGQLFDSLSATVPTGALEGDNYVLSYEGLQTNANANKNGELLDKDVVYEITAVFKDDTYGNYVINNKSISYVIRQKEVTLTWSSSSLEYSGTTQAPTVTTASGLVTSDSNNTEKVALSYTAGQKDVGTNYSVTASFTGTSANNYTITNSSHTYSITPYSITIYWNSENVFNFNGNNVVFNPILPTLLGNDEATLAPITGARNANVKPNGDPLGAEYTVTVTLPENIAGNYTVSNPIFTYTIKQVELTLGWTNTTLVYTGSVQMPTASISTTKYGDVGVQVISGSATNANAKPDGTSLAGITYTATAELTGTDKDNYVIVNNGTCNYLIKQKEVSITWANDTGLIYSGTVQKPTATAVSTDLVGGQSLTINVTLNEGSNGIDAIKHYVTASSADSNYAVKSAEILKEYTIGRQSLTLTWSSNTLEYNGYAQAPTVTTVSGLVNADKDNTDKVAINYTPGQKDAGKNYTVTASLTGTSANNYTITNSSYAYEITKFTITIDWNSENVFNFNGQSVVFTPTLPTLLGNDEATLASITGARDANATPDGTLFGEGKYSVEVILPDNIDKNYSVSNAIFTYIIKQAELTIGWDKTILEYTGLAQKPVPSITTTTYGNVGVEVVEIGEINANSKPTTIIDSSLLINSDKALYTATAKLNGTDKDNYVIATNGTCNYVIKQRVITITWSNINLMYTGFAIAPTATPGNLVTGQSVKLTITGAQTDAGEGYTATVTSILYNDNTNTVNTNYALPTDETISASFSISKYVLTITIYGTTITYGADIPELSSTQGNGVIYYTITGLQTGDNFADIGTLNVTTKYEKYSKVGSYSVTANEEELTSDKYTINFVYSGQIVVNPYVITSISWDTDLTYKAENQLPTAKFTSLRQEDSNKVIVGSANSTENFKDANITYYAKAIGTENSNYVLSEDILAYIQEYTISPYKITSINWGSTTLTYNGGDRLPSATFTLLDSVNETNKTNTIKVGSTLSAGTYKNVGEYTAVVLSSNNSNYVLSEELVNSTKTYTITPKTLSIEWIDATVVYDGKEHFANAKLIGICGSDIVNMTLTGSGIYVGDYEIAVTGIDNSNYTLPSQTTGKLSITKAPITNITWDSLVFTYKYQTSYNPTVTGFTGKVGSDDVYINVTSGPKTNAGTYNITVELLGDSKNNYMIGEDLPTFTIKPYVIQDSEISNITTSFIYSGTQNCPDVSIIINGYTLVNNEDYTITYTDNINAGTGKAVITAKGNYKIENSYTRTFTINRKAINDSDVIISVSGTYVFNNSAIKPTELNGQLGNVNITKGIDFDITGYSNNINAGSGIVTITGKGNYTGSKDVSFTINKGVITFAINKDYLLLGETFGVISYLNGQSHTLTITPSITYDQTTPGSSIGELGYTISATETDNYIVTALTGVIDVCKTIDASELTVQIYLNNTIYANNAEYSGSAIGLSIKVYYGETELDSAVYNSPVFSDLINAGTHTVTITGNGVYSQGCYYIVNNNQNSKVANYAIQQLHVTLNTNLLEKDYTSTLDWSTFKNSLSNDVKFVKTNDNTIFDVGSINVKGMHNGFYYYGYEGESAAVSNYSKPETKLLVGSTYIVTISLNRNFILDGSNYFVLKYKTAKLNDVYYTIEDAIYLSSASNTIILEGNASNTHYILTSFTKLNREITGYTDNHYILKCKLRIPFANVDMDYHGSGGEKGSSGNQYDQTQVTVNNTVYSALYIPNDICLNLTKNSHLVVGGLIGHQSKVYNRGVLMNNGTIIAEDDANISSYGYIKGSGMIEAHGGKVVDVFNMLDWRGGAKVGGLNQSKVFPMNAYTVHNISCNIKIFSGTTYEAFWTVEFKNSFYTGYQRGDKNGNIVIVGNNGLFNLINGYIFKSANEGITYSSKNELSTITGSNQSLGQKDKVEIYGKCFDSSVSLSISVMLVINIDVKTSTDFPVSISYMDVVIGNDNNGNVGDLTLQTSSYKFYPGSSLTVERDAKLTISKDVNLTMLTVDNAIIDQSVIDSPFITSNGGLCIDKFDAKLICDGMVQIDSGGRIGGIILTNGSTGEITFNESNISKVKYVTSYSEGTLLDNYGTTDFTHNAYIYLYNDNSSSISETLSQPNINTTYYAKNGGWIIGTTEYQINYSYIYNECESSGTVINSNKTSYAVNEKINLSLPTDGELTFVGWYLDESCTIPVNTIVGSNHRMNINLYGKWVYIEGENHIITFNPDNGSDETSYELKTGAIINLPSNPEKVGYTFLGWYTENGEKCPEVMPNSDLKLKAKWKINTYVVTFMSNNVIYTTNTVSHGSKVSKPSNPTPPSNNEFKYWKTEGGQEFNFNNPITSDLTLYAHFEEKSSGNCLVAGTLITMADGTLKKVEDILPGELLLVFNHETGQYDVSPVVFNDHDSASLYTVINLEFSNNKVVKVVSEHGFFDLNLMKYVYIDEYNYNDYVGHRFYAQDGNVVTLDKAYLTVEYVEVYSPVTAYHLNYFTEGILSMPGGIPGLFNIFEYGDNLQYNEEAKQADIEKYGLFTYEDDFKDYTSLEFYSAFPTAYLKVAIGKGLVTFDEILYYIERYQPKTE